MLDAMDEALKSLILKAVELSNAEGGYAFVFEDADGTRRVAKSAVDNKAGTITLVTLTATIWDEP